MNDIEELASVKSVERNAPVHAKHKPDRVSVWPFGEP